MVCVYVKDGGPGHSALRDRSADSLVLSNGRVRSFHPWPSRPGARGRSPTHARDNPWTGINWPHSARIRGTFVHYAAISSSRRIGFVSEELPVGTSRCHLHGSSSGEGYAAACTAKPPQRFSTRCASPERPAPPSLGKAPTGSGEGERTVHAPYGCAQQRGQMADQFTGDVEHGAIHDHAGSWAVLLRSPHSIRSPDYHLQDGRDSIAMPVRVHDEVLACVNLTWRKT